ncbi:Hypothetical predicted protein [Paramuricea clavata]|uniref:Uncharacterized protein n=1 Tax=Paramuricea clavata TaxID=317549 RepID=A0A7D9IXQ1_PARCT|nr:Hypothetical predicted protein [Paramuricea clavata]
MVASGARNVLKSFGQINRALLPQMQTIRDSKLGKPFYLIYVDYKNVLFDFCKFVYKKPAKAVRNFSVIGALVGIWYTNPETDSYTTQLMENANTLLLLSNKVRNAKCNETVQRLVKLNSENRLLVHNLGFFSLVRQKEHNDVTCVYEARCYYLKERWLYLYKDVVDIGFLGKWHFLEKAMVDYDINDAELSWLPVN